MVNNLQANSETEREPTSGNDDNVNGNTLSGCSSNDDINPSKYYARRRKCNENVQVCEKQKKRESYQRVSSIWILGVIFFVVVSCVLVIYPILE